MKGDGESGISLSQALVAEDMHFHLKVVDWRETRRAYMEPRLLRHSVAQHGSL